MINGIQDFYDNFTKDQALKKEKLLFNVEKPGELKKPGIKPDIIFKIKKVDKPKESVKSKVLTANPEKVKKIKQKITTPSPKNTTDLNIQDGYVLSTLVIRKDYLKKMKIESAMNGKSLKDVMDAYLKKGIKS